VTTSETFVSAAFLVFLAVACAYVFIHGLKLARLARDVARLEDELR
jgi:hypothetical protein